MKKQIIFILFAATLTTIAATIDKPNPVVGRWVNVRDTPNGKVELMANFRADNTYDGFINNKAFVTGKYWIKNDTLGVSDASCNASYYGVYKLYFKKDSLYFTVIQDTCRGRREGTSGLGFVRMKATAKN